MVPAGDRYLLRAAAVADLPAWAACAAEQQRTNGAGGVYFSVYPASSPCPAQDPTRQAQLAEQLVRTTEQTEWLRIWLACAADAPERIIGAVVLRGPAAAAALHRCTLGIGLSLGHRGQGLGALLLDVALGWARSVPTLAWVDLDVFSRNEPARRLYRRFGFEERGTTPDAFRLDGVSIDDVRMTLRL